MGEPKHFDVGGRKACDKPAQQLLGESTVVPRDVTCGLCLHSSAMMDYREEAWWKARDRGER